MKSSMKKKSKVKAILVYFNSDFTTVTYGGNKQYKLNLTFMGPCIVIIF